MILSRYGSLHPRKTIETRLAEPLEIHGLTCEGGRIAEALADVGVAAELRYHDLHRLSRSNAKEWRLPGL
ncbi:hypothetical protein [Rhodospirillum rubrum]|nr:hypothetical protein [Rhodospirillum rubrum]AEO47323.1 hypothetical protein F11_04265 [Rhodospirillum rubrum F11]